MLLKTEKRINHISDYMVKATILKLFKRLFSPKRPRPPSRPSPRKPTPRPMR